ncbi:cytochrome b/b6 domain-containing protein [Streptomyces sp. NPDC051940]|uniref:cytochrome b/b6 domain-containing protein n=1 Tax=Streptomyces sp. NPDC051940 TaxID=3155675 RepID=UPI003444F09A
MAARHTAPGPPTTRRDTATVTRNNARTRWFHAGVYVVVSALLLTGWWLTLGHEGDPSVLAELLDTPDPELHTNLGWALASYAAAGALLGWRGARTLLRDSVRFRRSDLRWFARLPGAAFTGRFARHEGHFDPGQRIANLLILALLLVLIVTGIGLDQVSGGPAFVWYRRIHVWSTYALTPVIAGHILIAAGVLPGYRGVWRAMHLGGRLRRTVAGRLWPEWLERDEGKRPR